MKQGRENPDVRRRDVAELTGRTVVITGGSGVLCGHLAEALAAKGARVCLVAHSRPAQAEEAASHIVRHGGEAMAYAADVLNKDSLEALHAAVVKRFGFVDTLINGAGGAKPEATTSGSLSFFDLPEDAIRWVFDLNVLGTILPCQIFGRHMAERNRGCILNIASMGAFKPLTRSVAYSAAKAAVVNFTQWLAVHMSQEYSDAIRVNALAPGFFLTEQNRFLLLDEETGQFTERGRRIIEHTPMARLGKPGDLVGPALMLLSDAAAFVHGTTLVVDGGLGAYGGV